MSDPKAKAAGARAYLRNQLNPAVRPLYDAIERDEFVFKGPNGESVAMKSGELTPDTLARLSSSGYSGSLPLAKPGGGWVEGKLENLRGMANADLALLPVLRGSQGAKVFLDEASVVASEELGERNLEAFTSSLARTGSLGLSATDSPAAAYRDQRLAEENLLPTMGGALVGTIPSSVGASRLAGAAGNALRATRGAAAAAETLPVLGGRVAPVGSAALDAGLLSAGEAGTGLAVRGVGGAAGRATAQLGAGEAGAGLAVRGVGGAASRATAQLGAGEVGTGLAVRGVGGAAGRATAQLGAGEVGTGLARTGNALAQAESAALGGYTAPAQAAQWTAEMLPMVESAGTAGARALGSGAVAATETGAATGGRLLSNVADDLAVELVANTQLSLADHALYDEELTAQSLASDIVPNTIFGGVLSLGLRGAGAAVGKALKPLRKEATAAGEIYAGPQKVREFVDEVRGIEDPLEVARRVGDRVVEAVSQVDGMPPGTAKAAVAQLPMAQAVARKTGYDVASAMKAVSDIDGPKYFSGIKSGMPLDPAAPKITNGVLRHASTLLTDLERASGALDAGGYRGARAKIENVRVLVESMARGHSGPMTADDFIGTIDKLADSLLEGADASALSDVATTQLRALQKAIRDGVKHNPAVLGEAGDLMRRADAGAQKAMTALTGMRKYIDKDLNPEALGKALMRDTASGEAANIIKHAQDLEDAARVFETLGTKEGLEYGARLRSAAASVTDSYAQLFARGDNGLSAFEAIQIGRQAGKRVQDTAKRGLLKRLFDHTTVATGYLVGAPGSAYVFNAGVDAVYGAWKAGGSANKVQAFGAAHSANNRFFEGIRKGQEALSSAISGKEVRPIAGSAGAVGIAGYRGYKTAEDKRRAFEDLSKRISELTTDPDRFISEIDQGLAPFAGFDRAVADEMAMTIFRQAQYLNETLPQANYGPFAGDMSDSVSDSEIDIWMSVAHIFQQPTDAIHECAAGTLEPQQVEALRITSPKLYNEIVGAALDTVGTTKDLPFNVVSSLSTLVGYPLDPLLEGAFIHATQNMGAQTQAQDQAINGTGKQRANLPSKTYVTQTTRTGEM